MESFYKKLSAILLGILTLQIGATFSQQYIPSRTTRTLNPPRQAGDSIQWVTVRDYEHPITRIPMFYRIEQIQAVITQTTDRVNRRDFHNDDRQFMRNYLQARRGDEAGHLVAATLGGVGMRYNLVSQHRSVNANRNANANGRQILAQWFNTENAVRTFLQNNPGGHVVWNVRVNYGNNLNNRRPTSFELRVTCVMANGDVDHNCSTFGNIGNDLPRRGRQW